MDTSDICLDEISRNMWMNLYWAVDSQTIHCSKWEDNKSVYVSAMNWLSEPLWMYSPLVDFPLDKH